MNEIGIYKILSPSGKIYVGMTADSFQNRWNQHLTLLKRGNHHCVGLQRAFNKWGILNIKFEIVERLPLDVNKTNILLKEQEWWDYFNSQNIKLYNARPSGKGSVYHSNETKEKIRQTIQRKLLEKHSLTKNDIKVDFHNRTTFKQNCDRVKCFKVFYGKHNQKFCSKFCASVGKFKKAEITKETLESLYWEQNKTLRIIADELKVSRTSVMRMMNHFNIPRRK